jgi:periplasmic protein TonB
MLLQAQVLPDSARRPLVLLAIAALHVLLIAALANGFAQRVFSALTQPTVVRFYDQPSEKPHPPDLPTVAVGPVRIVALHPEKPTIEVPPIDPSPTSGGSSIVAPPLQPGGAVTAATSVPPPIVLLGRNQLPNTEDYYPAAARRREEQGAAQVRACVNAGGRLEGAQLVGSSGHKLLDDAAIDVLRAGHYARATRAGEPIANCYDFRITFRIR